MTYYNLLRMIIEVYILLLFKIANLVNTINSYYNIINNHRLANLCLFILKIQLFTIRMYDLN